MKMRFLPRRIPAVRQHEGNDCGAACLASVAAWYGLRVPLARVHHLASTDRSGTNVLGLIQAATRLGFLAKGVRADAGALRSVSLPAIAHVLMDGRHHYVVVYRLTAREVVFMDPDRGAVRRLGHDEFAAVWDGVLVLLSPGEHFRAGDHTVSPMRRLWGMVSPHRGTMLQALAGAVLYTVLGLSTAVYLRAIVDHVIPGGNQNLLNLLSLGMLALLAAQVFIGVSQELLLLGVGRRLDGQLIMGYYRHLLRLPHRFFNGRRVGDLLSRVNDAAKIRAFVTAVSLKLVLNTLILAFSLGLAFLYSWKLALLLLGILVLYAAVYVAVDRVNRRNERAMMERSADLQSWLVESVEGVATVRHFAVEEYAALQTETRLVQLLRTVDRAARATIGSGNASEMLSRLAVVLVLWVGGGMVLRQEVTPGELLSLYALLAYLTGPVGALIGMNRDVHDAFVAADRLFELLDLSAGEEAGEARVELSPEDAGDIVFEGVVFRYGAALPVFRGLTMTIPAHRTTAIVGESGSGKSTLLSLLHKTETIEGGHITIGGVDLAYVSTESLRRCVGVVPQKVELFSGTLLGNIAMGDFDPDVRRVLELSERLGITEFAEKLPRGFMATIGENGATLSGGQRQRIAVARALYRDPPVLVLDEATSSLDSASERRIQVALDELRADRRTVVVIAHRLSTVMHADRIIVLADGAVAEEGTHAELLERRGAYHRLWREQFAGDDALEPAAGPSAPRPAIVR